ncbi:hypothetical protein [Kangiella sp.]|uniref:hypothetical protein n=1 Tax=Kangiella sp. TaxID=1920245 RepID=UPI003A935F59
MRVAITILLTFFIASCGTSTKKVSSNKKQTTVKKYNKSNICDEIRATFLSTINAGASVMTISKGANDLYHLVRTGGQASHCNYIRYSFRTLKKPYNGKSVSPSQWDRAIKGLVNRS